MGTAFAARTHRKESSPPAHAHHASRILGACVGGDNSSAFRKTTHQDRPNGLQSFACAEATNDNPWRLVTLPPPSPDVHPDLRPAGQKSLSPRFHRRCTFLSDSRFLSQFHGLREEHVKLKRIFGSLGCASRRAFFRLCRLLHNDTGAGCMKTLPVSYTAYAGCTRPLSFFFLLLSCQAYKQLSQPCSREDFAPVGCTSPRACSRT